MKRVTVTGTDTTVILNEGFYLPFCEQGYVLKSKNTLTCINKKYVYST